MITYQNNNSRVHTPHTQWPDLLLKGVFLHLSSFFLNSSLVMRPKLSEIFSFRSAKTENTAVGKARENQSPREHHVVLHVTVPTRPLTKADCQNNVTLEKQLLGIVINAIEREDRHIRHHPLLVLESQFSVQKNIQKLQFWVILFFISTCLFALIILSLVNLCFHDPKVFFLDNRITCLLSTCVGWETIQLLNDDNYG